MATTPRRRRRGIGLLWVLLLLAVIAILAFFLLGGSFDLDADVNAPDVQVDPGELPDVDVNPAPSAEAASEG